MQIPKGSALPMSQSLSPAERSLRGQLAAHTSWAHTDDRSARTANARKAALDRFQNEVDPEGVLLPQERAKRAEHLRKAYFARLALKSAQVRRRRASLPQESHSDLGLTSEVLAGGES
jgi:hypothetical protein